MDLGWERFLNLVRAELGEAKADPITAQKPTIQDKKIDVKYQAYTNKWLPDVINTQDYAGVLGQAISCFRGNTVRTRRECRKTCI